MNTVECLQCLKAGLNDMGISLSEQQCEQMIRYLELLVEWNQRMNLTGHDDPLQMVSYHLLDSLSLLPYIKGKRVCDVGTGAGLPGIPLAIADPSREYCLLDSRLKRVQFVRHVCWQLELGSVVVEKSRMESFCDAQGFDTIVARAVADASSLIKQTDHLLAEDGQWSLMKGDISPEEQAGIDRTYDLFSVTVPGINHARQVVVIPK